MKDTYEIYDAHDTQAVRDHNAKQARIAQRKERDGAVALAAFLPLWSADDPQSKLARFLRFAPVFCIGAPALFAGAVALGFI